MTNNEVNKVIAEYMGWYQKKGTHIQMWFKEVNGEEISETSACIGNFTNSLDALVPVWERLKVRDLKFLFNNYAKNKCFIGLEVVEGSSISSSSEDSKLNIQEAAAHAAAKVILELK